MTTYHTAVNMGSFYVCRCGKTYKSYSAFMRHYNERIKNAKKRGG